MADQTPVAQPKKTVLDYIKLAAGLATLLASMGVIKGKAGDTINKVAPVVNPILNNL
jgi:hypothetical protein